MRTLSYHPLVPSEVREIITYYTNISDLLADGFWQELTEALEYARQHPERHHFDTSGRRRGNLSRYPYHFLFRILPHTIRITAVRHNNRAPRRGSRRL